jgi:ATP-dependent Lon protease
MTASREKTEARKLPMMPLRDMVIFPYMMMPFVANPACVPLRKRSPATARSS